MRKRMVFSASKKRKNTNPCEQVLDKGSDEGQKIPRRRIGDSEKWEISKNELVAFQREFGHLNVSSGTNSINQRLGNWAKVQRFQHKLFTTGKDSLMTQERVDQLEAIKFDWSSTRQKKKRKQDVEKEKAKAAKKVERKKKKQEEVERKQAERERKLVPQLKRKNWKTEAQKLKESVRVNSICVSCQCLSLYFCYKLTFIG